MRNNFRPNIRLATNVLLVIGTFSVAFNLAPMAKESRLKYLCNKFKYNLEEELNFKKSGEDWERIHGIKYKDHLNRFEKKRINIGKKIISFYDAKGDIFSKDSYRSPTGICSNVIK